MTKQKPDPVPADTEPLNPWDKDEFWYVEAPAYIHRMYGFKVSVATVYRWMTKGLPDKETGFQLKLASEEIRGRRFIKRADLDAFLRNT